MNILARIPATNSRRVQRILGSGALAALLSACSGTELAQPSAASHVGASILASGAARLTVAAPTTPQRSKQSWILPSASKGDLLYVTDGTSAEVHVYSYPGGKSVGTLTGFLAPQGTCVDGKGDVFIADWSSGNLLEYAHGGTSPIRTISQPREVVLGCAVDSNSGDLAVSNYCRLGTGNTCEVAGSIAIYKGGSGTPTLYSDSEIYYMYFCGYDNRGNLYADGRDLSTHFELAELQKGSGAFTNITVDRQIYFPGGVQWDGTYLAVGDQEAGREFGSSIHQVAVSGSKGTVVGTTPLGSAEDVAQFWLQGSKVIGPDFQVGAPSDARVWSYPGGGKASKAIGHLEGPIGATVSKAN